MSFLFRRGETWWYYWSEGGHKQGKSLKTGDKKEAEVLKGEEDKRRLFGGTGIALAEGKWATFFEDYLQFSKTKSESGGTYRKDREVLEALERAVKPVLFKDISQKVIESYMTLVASKTSKSNANVHYRHLKAAFNKAVEWEFLQKSPFHGVKQFKLEARHPRFLSKAEIDEMLERAKKDSHPDAYGLAMVFLWTGVRLAEALSLKWQGVDFENDWIKIFGKGSKERKIPLHPKLSDAIWKYQKADGYVFGGDSPISRFTVQGIFRDRVLPKGTSIHTLRHTFASYAVMSGMDLNTLKEILGHTSITTTMIYAHLARPHIQEGMKKVTFR